MLTVSKTHIAAPISRCYKLVMNIDFHTKCMEHSQERAIDGITNGQTDLNKITIWQARHFFLLWKMTTVVTALQSPNYIKIKMTGGPFSQFDHQILFHENTHETIMTDIIELKVSSGIFGKLLENLLIEKRMRYSLLKRNEILKKTAESDEWKNYLTDSTIPTEKA